ncbi:hypothetical protein AW879_09945 [Enterobacter cloacae]|nr:hypothetical protein AW879_09945 [Enterobacter cloacae]
MSITLMKCEATHLAEDTMVCRVKKIKLVDYFVKLINFNMEFCLFINFIYLSFFDREKSHFKIK